MLNQLCKSRSETLSADDPRRVTVPRDVLDRWDALVALPDLARDGTSAVDDADAAHRADLRAQYRAWIEAGLQEVGPDGPPVPG